MGNATEADAVLVPAGAMDGPWMNALCLVFPNRENVWIDAEEDMVPAVAAWKARHPEFAGTEATMGAVQVRMPRSVYEGKQAVNELRRTG